jgi:S1-C subfamily serine protease
MAPLIVRVAPGSPAERAGLAVGDRVTTIDGMSIRDQADMLSRFAAAGSTVAVAVERKGRLLSVAMRCEDE